MTLTPTDSRSHPVPTAPPQRGAELFVLGGAVVLASTGAVVALSGVTAATAAFWRCVLALVVLVPLALAERRRRGGVAAGPVGWAAGAGVLLGLDFLAWTQSVLDAGSGVANVLLNVQVVALPLLAWALTGARPARRHLIATPVLLGGLALAGGVLGAAPDATAPGRGAALGLAAGLAYAGYLLLGREATRRSGGLVFVPVAVATAAAAVITGVLGGLGGLGGGIAVDLPWRAWAWLAVLAMAGQVLAWVLVSRGSAALPAGTAGALLLVHPVVSVLVGAAVLSERPTPWQLLGCVTVVLVVGAVVGTVTGRPRRA